MASQTTASTKREDLSAAKRAGWMTRFRSTWVSVAALAIGLVLWWAVSLIAPPLFVPSPFAVISSLVGLWQSGELQTSVAISYMRILVGWVLGCLVAVPLGILAGRSRAISDAIQPFVNFFRFVPPIAFLSVALLWFGVGEWSKISLIIYTTIFSVFLTTMIGAANVPVVKVNAAQSLGANRWQVLRHVVVPSATPAIVTGARSAMGFAFMTVVAAEMVAAREGIGYLIYNSRVFAQTEQAFGGILVLGLMGFVADAALRLMLRGVTYRRHGSMA